MVVSRRIRLSRRRRRTNSQGAGRSCPGELPPKPRGWHVESMNPAILVPTSDPWAARGCAGSPRAPVGASVMTLSAPETLPVDCPQSGAEFPGRTGFSGFAAASPTRICHHRVPSGWRVPTSLGSASDGERERGGRRRPARRRPAGQRRRARFMPFCPESRCDHPAATSTHENGGRALRPFSDRYLCWTPSERRRDRVGAIVGRLSTAAQRIWSRRSRVHRARTCCATRRANMGHSGSNRRGCLG